MNLFDRVLILVASALEAASKLRKTDSKLWVENESERIRYEILSGVARIERSEATRSHVSRAHEGPLVEVWTDEATHLLQVHA